MSWSRRAWDFITLLITACNLKYTNYIFLEFSIQYSGITDDLWVKWNHKYQNCKQVREYCSLQCLLQAFMTLSYSIWNFPLKRVLRKKSLENYESKWDLFYPFHFPSGKGVFHWKNNFKLAESILSIKCKTIIEKQNFLGGLGGGVLYFE